MATTMELLFTGDASKITARLDKNDGSTSTVTSFTINEAKTINKSSVPNTGFNPVTGTVVYWVRLIVEHIDGELIDGITNDYPFDPVYNTDLDFEYDAANNYWYAPITPSHFGDGAAKSVEITVDTGAAVLPIPAPFNRLYQMTPSLLRELGDEDIDMGFVPGDDTSRISRSGYIISLLNLGYELPAASVGPDSLVSIGDYDSSVTAPTVKTETIHFDLGSMTIDDLSNTSVDFAGTSYQLVIPGVETPIDIPTAYLDGTAVTAEMLVDAYHGQATVNVFKSGETVPLLSKKVAIGRKIPLRTLLSADGTQDSFQGVLNGVLTPYIRRVQREYRDGDWTRMVTVEGDLTGLTGAVIVDHILLGGMGLEEQSMIESALTNGVWIA